MKYSVIDVSSSSLSLVVAAADEHKTEILFKERKAISLVHYLEGRKLTERGIEKLVDCLHELKEACVNLGVERCYLISTAALRHIENFEEVYARVREEAGLTINVIDAATEAYCDYIANVYFRSYERPVLIDLGGKSIEVCDLSKQRKEEMQYFPFGLIDLYRKFVDGIFPTEKEAKAIKRYVKHKFDRADLPGEDVFSTAVMVGAANAALYDVYADFAGEKTEGARVIRYKKFKKLVKHLLTGEDRSKLILNNAPEKLYIIASAAIVLKVLFKRFGVDNILVSDRGVKEGYLQLVLDGSEQGEWCDLVTGERGGEARHAPMETASAPEQAAAPKKRGRKPKAQPAAENAAPMSEPAPKKRGRKPKAQPAAENAAPMSEPAPKKRGRKPKAQPAAENAAPMSEPAPKKRGRKPKTQLAAENAAPMSAPAPKKRGRPKKSAPAEAPADAHSTQPSDETQPS